MNKKNQPWDHRHLFNQVQSAVTDIFSSSRYADKVIEYYLSQNKKWGSRDRRYFAETTYDVVRHWRYLQYLHEAVPNLSLLEVHHVKNHRIPQWLNIDEKTISQLQKVLQISPERKIKESVPDWLDEYAEAELQSEWNSAIHSLNQPAPVDLRVNLLQTNAQDLQKKLAKEGIETTALSAECLTLKERKNVFVTAVFKQGLFEVQDRSSQRVAHFLDLKPGLRVVDACAGAGGKSLHIGTLMGNKGRVIALDVHEKKLVELKKRAARNRIDVIEARTIESTKVIKRLENSADRLLLDVPCSGLGVLRRNPDSKWKLSAAKMEQLQVLQKKLLADYSTMLKKDGVLVYSTCSILPSENQKQIAWFLENFKSFRLLNEEVIFPGLDGGDGFYMSALKRTQ
jgi:16S rRNA (cytosine967-C5)-methyltransferase